MDTRFDKLKRLICHGQTSEHERSAALERLLDIVRDGGGPVTHSVKIGPRRQRTIVDEWTRLQPYIDDLKFGDAIAGIYRACEECSVQPLAIDFGEHDNGECVVAVDFLPGACPNGLDMQDALRKTWSGSRVTAAIEQDDTKRTYLFFLGLFGKDRSEDVTAMAE